jgi:trans-2,3-dihydro-3-hydroxyanthranilate isomerase
MQRRYITVDVFTDRAFGGNPLAVVLDAGGLSTAQMQAIATEFNYSETTFVLPPQDAANDAQVRIFTVRSEIPFAGHPNVGTAFVLATQAAKPPPRLKFEEKAGLVPVEILTQQGRVVGAELTAPQPLKRLTQLSAEQAAGCLSLSTVDVKTDRHPPQLASVGLPFLMVELSSREALRRAKPDAAAFARTFPLDGCDAVYFYTRDVPAGEAPCDLQARMFHPGSSGLSEDPATGSATVAAAALLADLAPERDGEIKLRIGQGVDMGRPSLLLTRVVKRDGAIVSAHVGGGCVQMMEGTFYLSGES